MVPPFSRKGAFGDQKGPRMAEDVGSTPVSEMSLWAISSTRLVDMLGVPGKIIHGRSNK